MLSRLLIEFVPGTRVYREPEVVSKLPIVPNGPPGGVARVKSSDIVV